MKYDVYNKVIYVPTHAKGPKWYDHTDIEMGFVSSVNSKYVFVKFLKNLVKFDWSGVTAQSCNPSDLEIMSKERYPFNLEAPIPLLKAHILLLNYGELHHSFWKAIL